MAPRQAQASRVAEQKVARVRTRTRWFHRESARTVPDLASAMAFIVWRQSVQVVRNMRSASFSIEAGEAYFECLVECLIFLAQAADRLAFYEMPVERAAFTVALVRHLADHAAGNWNDLMGEDPMLPGYGKRFIERFNLRIDVYLGFDGDDSAATRYLADLLIPRLALDDRQWAHAQIMEYERPTVLQQLRSAFASLRDSNPGSAVGSAATAGE